MNQSIAGITAKKSRSIKMKRRFIPVADIISIMMRHDPPQNVSSSNSRAVVFHPATLLVISQAYMSFLSDRKVVSP